MLTVHRPRHLGLGEVTSRRSAVLATVSVVAVIAAVSGILLLQNGGQHNQGGVSRSQQNTTYPSTSEVVSAIEQTAAANGDNNLQSVTIYDTTRANADVIVNVTANGGPDSDTADATVAFTSGSFVDTGANVPPGGTAPTGSVLVIVMNDAGAVTDFGLLQNMPTLPSGMGSPTVVNISGPSG